MIIDAVYYPWHLKGVLPQKEGDPGYKIWSYLYKHVSTANYKQERGDLAVSNEPLTVEGLVARLDQGGIDKAMLHHQTHMMRGDKWTQDPKLVPQLVDQYPKRFIPGGYDVDPNDGMNAVREFRDAVKSYGYTSLYVSPAFSMYPYLPPSHALYYPLYAACIDLDVAFMVVTRTPISGPVHGPTEYLHPYHLDQVAMHFPELRIVGRAFPWPWTQEMLAMVWKHENVYMTTSHFATKNWPQSFVNFVHSPKGMRRTIFSTGGPLQDPASYIAKVKERLGDLSKDFEENYFHKNAIEAFKLKL